MTPEQRTEILEHVQSDVTAMMTRAGDILMEYVNILDDGKLESFVKEFSETARTALLNELVKTIQCKETKDAVSKK
jgi:hypothetical protein